MGLGFLHKLFGPRPPAEADQRAASAEAVAAHLRRLAEGPATRADSAPAGLAEAEAAAFWSFVTAARCALLMRLLRLRGRDDMAAAAALRAFAAALHGERADDLETLLARIERDLRADARRLAERHGWRLVGTAFGLVAAPALFEEAWSYLDRAIGFVERATAENFDERAYLAANPDVARSVAQRRIASGRAHFIAHGGAEARSQRRFGLRHRHDEEFVYPLQFCRDPASNAPGGRSLPGARVDVAALLSEPPRKPYSIAILREAEEHDATPALAVDASIGQETAQFEALLKKRRWTAATLYLAALPDACADLPNGAAIFDRDKAWSDSFYATILSPGGDARAPDIFPIAGRYARLRRASDEQTQKSAMPLMLCATWAARINYGHWLMNGLFSAYLVLDELRAGRLGLLCPPLTDRQRNELLALGAPADSIVESAARYARSDRLIYPSPLATFANMAPSPRLIDFFAHLTRAHQSGARGPAPERVFLSRLGFPSARRMRNEAALAEALAKIGFHVAKTHELTLADQIRLMSNAKFVVGQFGAALWNIPFMPRGGRIVEIATSNYSSNEYLYVAHLCGHRLHRVMIDAASPQNRAYAGEYFEFDAPVAEIAALAQSLL